MRTAQIAVGAIVVALIVTFGFGAAFALLVILAAAYVLGALAMPLIVLAKLRVVQRPEVRAMEYDDASIPEVARTLLRAHRAALVAVGFEARDLVHLPAGSAPGGYLALYRHRESSASALSRVLLKPGKGAVAVMSEDAEFEMCYDNGTSAELSNVPGGIPGLELLPGIFGQMPQERDVGRLFDYFLKLVGRY